MKKNLFSVLSVTLLLTTFSSAFAKECTIKWSSKLQLYQVSDGSDTRNILEYESSIKRMQQLVSDNKCTIPTDIPICTLSYVKKDRYFVLSRGDETWMNFNLPATAQFNLNRLVSDGICKEGVDENSRVVPVYCIVHPTLYDRFGIIVFIDHDEFKNTKEYDYNFKPVVSVSSTEEKANQVLSNLVKEGICIDPTVDAQE